MALVVKDANFNDNLGDKKLQINGNSRSLHLKGNGFLTCDFPLEVIVLSENGTTEDKRIGVGSVGEDANEKKLSVIVVATDGENKDGSKDEIEEGFRDIVLKKKDSDWSRVKCLQNDDNDNSECALFVGAIELFR